MGTFKVLDYPLIRKLERVKGIEPSYSAWKAANTVAFSAIVLKFVFSAH
jgi:hypothetical protein